MRKVLVVVAVAMLACSVVGAEVDISVSGKIDVGDVRTNGTLGAFSASITQVGALEVNVQASVTTIGGDGVPYPYGTGSLNDQVWIMAQIYDATWSVHTWSYTGSDYHLNSPVALGTFATSYTVSVPRATDYQLWVAAIAGVTWPTTAYNWGFFSQGVSGGYLSFYSGPIATTYVDATAPPTPTFNPGGDGGAPIPTLNWLGMLAMVAMMLGVAVLVIIRRR